MGEHCPGPESLAGWLDQTLPAAERARVTGHLASCDDCRRATTLASGLKSPPEIAVDEIFLRRVVNASRRRPVGLWIAGAAAVVVAAVLVWPRGASKGPAVASAPPAPVPAPAPAPKPPPAIPDPLPPAKTELPAIVSPEPPSPVPEKKPDPVPPETPKEDPKKTTVAKEDPQSQPVEAPKEEPKPAARTPARATEADLSRVFASIFLTDPLGDLWINRQGGEPSPVARYEQVGYKDSLSTHNAPGAFALEGKATLAFDADTVATVAWKPVDSAYSLTVSKGTVVIDTENSSQSWQVSRGKTEFVIANLNGRFAIEPRGEQTATVMLLGRAEIRSGTSTKRLEAGREALLAGDGKLAEQPAKSDAGKRLGRLADARPKDLTVFAATFKEKGDEPRAFPYKIAGGRLDDGCLHAEVPANVYPKTGEKVLASCAVKPDRPIIASDKIWLTFRYRTNLPTFTIKLGKYSAIYTSHLKPEEWGEGKIALTAFLFEGVEIIPKDELTDVQFQAVTDGKKKCILDLDGVQFLRRSR